MDKISSFKDSETKIIADIRDCVSTIRNLVNYDFTSPIEGVAILLKIRQLAYEDLNQIQHEELVYRAATILKNTEFKGRNLEWFWNPRQTGDNSEPDLQAMENDEVVLSAEVTTSERPIGTIDSRMRDTLVKLSNMPGRKFYFVRTDEMEQRAKTKISKLGASIEVRKI